MRLIFLCKKYICTTILSAIILLCFNNNSNAQTFVQYVNVGTFTWTPPAGCTSWYAEGWGGGAGGNVNYGGGGGGYTKTTTQTVSGNASYTVVVGGGGCNGGNGSESSIAGIPCPAGVGNGGAPYYYDPSSTIAICNYGGWGGTTATSSFGCSKGYGGGGGSASSSAFGGSGGNGTSTGISGLNCSVTQGAGGSGVGMGGNGNSLSNTQPGGGSGAGPSGSCGSAGQVNLFYYCQGNGGSIAFSKTLPYPREDATVYQITSSATPTGSTNGLVYTWYYSTTGNAPWTVVPGSGNSPTCNIPATDNIGWYYKRVTNGCGGPANNESNILKVKVFSKDNIVANSPAKNGKIQGYIKSKTGNGVVGDSVWVKRTTHINGSPDNYTYKTVTGSGGLYVVDNIFYGDKDNGDPTDVYFDIIPVKQNHKFDPPILSNIKITYSSTTPTVIDIKDTTVISITGKAYQKCQGCLNAGNVVVNTVTCGVDSVKISGASIDVYSLGIDSGKYAASISDLGKRYTITPSYAPPDKPSKVHKFTPLFIDSLINDNVVNFNFEDTTTYSISGKLTGGGGDYIGKVYLLFTDTAAPYIFRKRDTTDYYAPGDSRNGNFSLRLPARRNYKVSVEKFEPIDVFGDSARVEETDLKDFFNTILPNDNLYKSSLYFNIDTGNIQRNLVYHRKPVIIIEGLPDTTCNPAIGIVFRQNIPRTFKLSVYEGPWSKGVKVTTQNPAITNPDSLSIGDSIKINSSIHTKTTATDSIRYRLVNGEKTATILPGEPNIVAALGFQKFFQVFYTDRYGRSTNVNRNAVVIGVQTPPATFITKSPLKPFLILHEPPGDGSSSWWKKTKSSQTATKFYSATGTDQSGYEEVSAGANFSAGVGVEIQTEISVKAKAGVDSKVTNTTNNEFIFTNSTSEEYTTLKGGSPLVEGESGDVYVGGALNFKMGAAYKVYFDPSNPCTLAFKKELLAAPDSFRTIFAYKEDHILHTLLPQLQQLADQYSGPKRDSVLNQMRVWQQVIDNNKLNKQNARFVENRSFSNGLSIKKDTTFSSSETNTLEYEMEIDASLALDVSAEVNGIGVGGGYNVTFREVTGKSLSSNITTETTTGFELNDDDPGDYYSVDIKEDKIYGTPVFELIAGASSCPPEPGTQSRDKPEIYFDPVNKTINNVPTNGTGFCTANVLNLSESGEARSYKFSMDGLTANGLKVYQGAVGLGGSDYIPVSSLAFADSRPLLLDIQKTNINDGILSYPDIKFSLSDACDGSVVDEQTMSINFASPCGTIKLDMPTDYWKITSAENNKLAYTASGYSYNTIDSIMLQYAKAGTNNWKTGAKKLKLQILDPASYTDTFNVAALSDTLYKIRLKLVCSGSTILTPSVTGLIDRNPPALFGRPQPAGGVYIESRDNITFTYNEDIKTDDLNSNKVQMIRLSNNSPVSITVTGTEDHLQVVPVDDLYASGLDSFLVIVNNISDLNGNVKSTPDSNIFKLGSVPVTINNSATDTVKVYAVTSSILENGNGKLQVHFKRNKASNKILKVYFKVSGTAGYGFDYDVTSDTIYKKICTNVSCSQFTIKPVYNSFNGTSGYIYIDSLKKEAILNIDPIGDNLFEQDETVKITLASGGDYAMTDSLFVIDTIRNDDVVLPIITANPSLSICGGDSVILTASATQKGNAIQFDGVSQIANLAPLSVTTNTMTFECWAYANGSQSSAAGLVFARGGVTPASGIGFAYLDPGKLGYNWNDAGSSYNWTGGPAYPLNTWFHTALVVEADKATLYLNGVPYVNNVPHLPVTFADITQLATDNCCSERMFNGKMDEVRIWNVARTKAEIVASMNASVPTNSPGLMAYYKFEEDGSIVKDATANGKSGTLENGTTRIVSDAGVVPYTSFLWSSGGATTPSIVVKNSGAYAVTVGDGSGNTATTSSVNVSLTPAPSVNAGTTLVDVCPGTASVSLGGSFGGGATGAVWSDNGAGGTFNNNTGTTPNTATYSPAASANGNLVLTITSTGVSCTATANKQIFVNGQSTWLGITGDWNLGSNWSNGVEPISCTKVIIPQSVANMPTITGTNNSCYRIDLQSGAILNVATGATLLITGH